MSIAQYDSPTNKGLCASALTLVFRVVGIESRSERVADGNQKARRAHHDTTSTSSLLSSIWTFTHFISATASSLIYLYNPLRQHDTHRTWEKAGMADI